MDIPKVSILMPVYRTAPFLREAMDSILAQQFGDFELIVLDDCSPDNAWEIVESYDDPRIVRYRGVENKGLGNVLNVGMDMARGEYIARMDSDDIALPERLQRQVQYLDDHPEIDFCSCAMELFGDGQGLWVRDADADKVRITALFFSPVLHASGMWRREAFERHGLHYNQQMVPAEDYDLWCRALVAGVRMVNLPDPLYRYRIREGQATADNTQTSPKERTVREAYFRAAFPYASQQMAVDFLALPALPHARMARLFWHMVAHNVHRPFFNSRKLALRLWRYYHSNASND